MADNYDYIIIGAGCAGLALAYRMSIDHHFANKQVLIIEPEEKNKNDRTWSYWSKTEAFYHAWASKSWSKIGFKSNEILQPKTITPYKYYTIKGEDYYARTLAQINQSKNIHWYKDKVVDLQLDGNRCVVTLNSNKKLEGDFCFDSRILDSNDYSSSNFVWQHFKGWVVESEVDYFDDTIALFMDFSIPQGTDTRFFYLLPYSKKKALIQLAVFSNEIISSKDYDVLLREYVEQNHPNLKFTIAEEEYDKIPMTDFTFPKSLGGQHMFIGSASGMVKPSSGYAFKRIQDQAEDVIEALKSNKNPIRVTEKIANKKYQTLDATLLDVILTGRLTGKEVFVQLLEKNKIKTVFDFLNQDSSVLQELKIMSSLPTLPFLKSFIKILTK